MQTTVNTPYLTTETAAAHLGAIHPRTIARWAREGYLPAIPVGEGKRRLWRFLKADLDEWMLSRRTKIHPCPDGEEYVPVR